MKKYLCITLVSIFAIFIGSSAAIAVDVKLNGSFYAAGMYLDKTSLTGSGDPSTAFYYQRLRMQADLVIHPSLKLVTRFDMMERIWGGERAMPDSTTDTGSAGTKYENENIAVDWVYIQYLSPIGLFRIGYMEDLVWGTAFMDSAVPCGKFAWIILKGPWLYTFQICKVADNSVTAKSAGYADADFNRYMQAVRYTGKAGSGGLLAGFARNATYRPTADFYASIYMLQPYVIAKIGPVNIQMELDYYWGDMIKSETKADDVKTENLAAYLDVSVNSDVFYVGGTIAYVSGDDPATKDKLEGNSIIINGGVDWNPCLILFNNELQYWAGSQSGHDASMAALNPYGYNNGPMTNAWLLQLRGGIKYNGLDVMASISYANADKKPTQEWLYNDYGYEIDMIATYKITPNLTYILGAGYLFTGDYFKGAGRLSNGKQASVDDDYLFITKLKLDF